MEISLKFVPRVPINNIPVLVQIMAWRRLGDKPLSEPMMDSLPTHICVTRPQWVNTSGTETEIFQASQVNAIAADALALCIARPSAAMILTAWKVDIVVLSEFKKTTCQVSMSNHVKYEYVCIFLYKTAAHNRLKCQFVHSAASNWSHK